MEKKSLRTSILTQRNNLTKKQVLEKSSVIKKKLLSLESFNKAKSVMLYHSFDNEVSTISLISHWLQQNKKVSLPYISNKIKKIEAFSISNLEEDVKKNKYGIMEPDITKCKKQNIKELDIIIVPGLAFDKNNNRLGFGFGYYDNFLKNKNPKTISIGLCYDFQLKDSIPIKEHDVPVDMVITDKEA